MRTIKVKLTQNQFAFLMMLLRLDDKQKATQEFARLMELEGIDPIEMPIYIDRLMQKGTQE